jgi:hypothetical protein
MSEVFERVPVLLIPLLIAACGSTATSTPTEPASPSSELVTLEGRTICPGSLRWVGENLVGQPADVLEEVQAGFENEPGFLAVVYDGTRAVIVVDSGLLTDWQALLQATDIGVAPSCINTSLLEGVMAVLQVVRPRGGGVSAGYDALDDTIKVNGVDANTLVSALDQWSPGTGAAATAAIVNGTLRIDPRPLPAMH